MIVNTTNKELVQAVQDAIKESGYKKIWIAEQKDPKSHSGYRQIDIPDLLVEVWADYLKYVDILLFTTRNGGQITKSSYDKMWMSILKKIDKAAFSIDKFYRIEGLTAHIFRHNYCTMLYYKVRDKINEKMIL